jgi:hypothetical protein
VYCDCSIFSDDNVEGLLCIWENTGNNFYSEIIIVETRNWHASDSSVREQTDSGGHFVTQSLQSLGTMKYADISWSWF